MLNDMSTSDWHYKLHKFFTTEEYYDLINGKDIDECDYFWKTLACMLGVLTVGFVCLVGVGMGLFGLTALGSLLLSLITPMAFLTWVNPAITLVFYGMLSALGVCIVASTNELEFYPTWWPEFLKYKAAPKRQGPGLFIRAYRRGKEKYCEKIKLKD